MICKKNMVLGLMCFSLLVSAQIDNGTSHDSKPIDLNITHSASKMDGKPLFSIKNLPTSSAETKSSEPDGKVVKVIDFTQEPPQEVVLADADTSANEAIKASRSLKRATSYTVRGKTYQTLAESAGFTQEGSASWYGPGFHGRKTASGEIFDMNDFTAAHKELPLGTEVEVTNITTGKSIVVRINDRGPFHGNRVLDLSRAAAKELGVIKHGTAKVVIRALQ